MLASLYLFLAPLLAVSFYIAFKFVWHREEILKLENNAFINAQELPNNLEAAKEEVFIFFDKFRSNFFKSLIIFFHWLFHFFVLFLKFISHLTDIMYAKARDLFLKTATKDRGVVSTFWHHLKEYKKESEEEKN